VIWYSITSQETVLLMAAFLSSGRRGKLIWQVSWKELGPVTVNHFFKHVSPPWRWKQNQFPKHQILRIHSYRGRVQNIKSNLTITKLTNPLTLEVEGSTPLIPKPAKRHGPKSTPFTSHSNNLFFYTVPINNRYHVFTQWEFILWSSGLSSRRLPMFWTRLLSLFSGQNYPEFMLS
jgi:hypothetical protein